MKTYFQSKYTKVNISYGRGKMLIDFVICLVFLYKNGNKKGKLLPEKLRDLDMACQAFHTNFNVHYIFTTEKNYSFGLNVTMRREH